MKINENFEIKDSLTPIEYLDLVNTLVDSHFKTSDDGEIEYRPDYATIMEDAIIVKHFTDAIEDVSDAISLDVVDSISNNDKVISCVDVIKNSDGVYTQAKTDANLRVDHIKYSLVHSNNSSAVEVKLLEILDKESEKLNDEIKANKYNDKLIKAQLEQVEYANKVSSYISPKRQAEITEKMANSNFDVSKVAEIMADQYFKSEKHEDNQNAILDEKNAQIADLKKYKDAIDARNVLSGK